MKRVFKFIRKSDLVVDDVPLRECQLFETEKKFIFVVCVRMEFLSFIRIKLERKSLEPSFFQPWVADMS